MAASSGNNYPPAEPSVCLGCSEHDVFNALDIFENESILKELKFGIGDGLLRYYLYNWGTSCNAQAADVGLVLL